MTSDGIQELDNLIRFGSGEEGEITSLTKLRRQWDKRTLPDNINFILDVYTLEVAVLIGHHIKRYKGRKYPHAEAIVKAFKVLLEDVNKKNKERTTRSENT